VFTLGPCPFLGYISREVPISAEAREQASKAKAMGSSKLKKNKKSACEGLTCG
jgi:hypothetical protein